MNTQFNKPKADEIRQTTEWYLQNGFGVVPIARGGKNPILSKWQHNYFKSTDDYQAWLGDKYVNHNVGLVTGKATGIIVIDIDKAKNDSEVDGEESLKALIEQLGELPFTVEQRTRSGARQLFFKYPTDVERIKGTVRLVDCIDIRADDNQVVVYPSYYADSETKEITGSWKWINNPYNTSLAELPATWIEFITQNNAQKPHNKPQEATKTQSSFNEGSRNDSLFKALCKFSTNTQLREFDNLLFMALGINQKLCNPPLEVAEVEGIVRNVIENYTPEPFIGEHGSIIYPLLAEQILKDNHILVDDTQKYIYNGKHYDLVNKNFYNEISSYIEDKSRLTTNTIREVNMNIQHLADHIDEKVDTRYINFQNGLFNVDTKQLEPHSHNNFSLGMYEANYMDWCSDITGTAWEQYLKVTLGEDMIPTIQELIGLCLFPLTRKTQKCFTLIGEGSNGKSVLLNTILKIIPSHLISDLSMEDYDTRFANASIKGKQVNIQLDDRTVHLDKIGNFKKVMSGEPIFIERKGVDGETITTNVTHISSFNKLPSVNEKSQAFLRRLVIIPFEKSFGTEEEVEAGERDLVADPNLEDKISKELDIIVAWGIEGLYRVIENNYIITEIATMKKAKSDYAEDSDVVQKWINECVVKHSDLPNKDCLKATQLYHAYMDWAKHEGYTELKRRAFDDRIKVLLKKQSHDYRRNIVYKVSFKGFNRNDL